MWLLAGRMILFLTLLVTFSPFLSREISRSSRYGGVLMIEMVENARKGNINEYQFVSIPTFKFLTLKIWDTTPEFGINTNSEIQNFIQKN